MFNIYALALLLFFSSCTIHTMDSDEDSPRLSNSTPAPHTKTSKNYVGLDNTSNETKKYNRGTAKSLPSSKILQSLSRNNISKKYFFITPNIVDDLSWEILDTNRTFIKNVAEKHQLEKSNFYCIIKNLNKLVIQDNPYIIALASYFLFTLFKEKDFEDLLNAKINYFQVSNNHYERCTESIKNNINKITKNSIQWPSTTRQENKELYYKELLYNNKSIDISITQSPYIAGSVAIQYIAQLAARESIDKKTIQNIIKSPKTIQKHMDFIQQSLVMQSPFINKKIKCSEVKNSKKTDNEKIEDDEE